MVRSEIREADGGLYLPVHVQPKSKREEILGIKDGILFVRLNTPPVEGAANKRLIEILAENLGIPKTSIQLAKGAKSKNKIFFIPGVTIHDLSIVWAF